MDYLKFGEDDQDDTYGFVVGHILPKTRDPNFIIWADEVIISTDTETEPITHLRSDTVRLLCEDEDNFGDVYKNLIQSFQPKKLIFTARYIRGLEFYRPSPCLN